MRVYHLLILGSGIIAPVGAYIGDIDGIPPYWGMNGPDDITLQPPLTYWLSPECLVGSNGLPLKVLPAILEAIEEARIASTLMSPTPASPAERLQARYFKLIFKADMDEIPAVTRVNAVFRGIASLTRNFNRESSNIRFQCDDKNNGYTLTPDIENGPQPLNSARPVERQEWNDLRNGLRAVGVQYPCQVNHPIFGAFQAYTSRSPLPASVTPGQALPRSSIMICDLGLAMAYATTTDIWIGQNLGGAKLEDFKSILSTIIFHEMTHTDGFFANDVVIGSTQQQGYGWKNVLAATQSEALNNADSFVFYAMLRKAQSVGFRLSETGTKAKLGELASCPRSQRA